MISTIFITCSGVAISTFGYFSSDNKIKKINETENKMANNMKEFKDIDTGNRSIIFANVINPKCSYIEIHKQKLVTVIKTQPVQQFNLNSLVDEKVPAFTTGIQQSTSKELKFKLHKVILTDPTFGYNFIKPSTTFNFETNTFLKDYFDSKKSDGNPMDGQTATNYLKTNFNLVHTLDNQRLYKIKDATLNGNKIFLSGRKFGDCFIYDNISFDPESLLHSEFDSNRLNWQLAKGLSLAGIFGSIGYGIMNQMSKL